MLNNSFLPKKSEFNLIGGFSCINGTVYVASAVVTKQFGLFIRKRVYYVATFIVKNNKECVITKLESLAPPNENFKIQSVKSKHSKKLAQLIQDEL